MIQRSFVLVAVAAVLYLASSGAPVALAGFTVGGIAFNEIFDDDFSGTGSSAPDPLADFEYNNGDGVDDAKWRWTFRREAAITRAGDGIMTWTSESNLLDPDGDQNGDDGNNDIWINTLRTGDGTINVLEGLQTASKWAYEVQFRVNPTPSNNTNIPVPRDLGDFDVVRFDGPKSTVIFAGVNDRPPQMLGDIPPEGDEGVNGSFDDARDLSIVAKPVYDSNGIIIPDKFGLYHSNNLNFDNPFIQFDPNLGQQTMLMELDRGVFHTVGAVHNPDNTVDVYVNGVLKGSFASLNAADGPPLALRMGEASGRIIASVSYDSFKVGIVPEPSSCTLLIIAGGALLAAPRKR